MQAYDPEPVPTTGPAPTETNPMPASRFVGHAVPAPSVTTPLGGHPALPESQPVAALPPYPSYVPANRPAAPAARTPRRPRGKGPILALALLAGLVTGSVGGGATAWTLTHASAAQPAAVIAPAAAPAQPVADTSTSAIGALYKRVANSVVDIQTTIGGTGRFSGSGEGSGIVLDTGHVLTNYHVVQGANSIRITLQDGTTVTGTVAGTAPQDDLAVVAATLPANEVTPAVLGNSDNLQVGDEVVAVGSPFGLANTVTAGIVSAVNREWSGSNQPAQKMIQTDTPINPGNSGGPLFDLQGEVVGINTAIESPVEGSVGVGFSIPINRAESLLPQLTQGSTVQRGWLGISGTTLTAALVQQLNTSVSQGVLVVGVTSGSPAAKAGLQGADPTTSNTAGDIITAVDSTATPAIDQLTSYLAGKHVGDTVTLKVVRNGQTQQIKVTLAAWPTTQPQTPSNGGSGNTLP